MRKSDFYRLLSYALFGCLLGMLLDNVALGLFLAASLYVVWVHRKLGELLGWIRNRKEYEAPESRGVFEDISLEIDYLRDRHKKRKKRMGNYLKQFKQATRALPDATIVLDLMGNVQWANKACEETLGVRWPDDVNQRITNLVRNPELVPFIDTPQHGASLDISAPLNKGRQYNIRLARYGKNQWLFVARDITDLQRAHQVRKDFVANVSHELKTPITVVKGYIETLQMQHDDLPGIFPQALQQMEAHTNRMQSLVEDLLLLSQLEQGETLRNAQPIAVAELISAVHQQTTQIDGASERIFSLELDPTLSIAGFAEALHSVLTNLLINAIRYTDGRDVIELRWYQDADGAHFSVKDHGIGIEEQHLKRLTERFYRVDSGRDRSEGGTGLGLAIVKHALSLHNATLHIESETGKGSLFRCDFPPSQIVVDSVEFKARHAN